MLFSPLVALRRSNIRALVASTSGLLVGVVGCSTQNASVTCGPGTTLVGSQCQVTAPDAAADGPAPDAGDDAWSSLDAADGAQPDQGSAGDDATNSMEASPEAAGEGGSEAGPVPTACTDGGGPAGDPCPTASVADCSNTCGGDSGACSYQPNGCAWSGDPTVSLQLDVVQSVIIRTPDGELDTAACSAACGEAGLGEASWSFAITTGSQWAKFTVPAPWRVVATGGDFCHPADNHCVLARTGAMIVAPQACMPARNIVIEPVSGQAMCP
jgi:hypothetical protein